MATVGRSIFRLRHYDCVGFDMVQTIIQIQIFANYRLIQLFYRTIPYVVTDSEQFSKWYAMAVNFLVFI